MVRGAIRRNHDPVGRRKKIAAIVAAATLIALWIGVIVALGRVEPDKAGAGGPGASGPLPSAREQTTTDPAGEDETATGPTSADATSPGSEDGSGEDDSGSHDDPAGTQEQSPDAAITGPNDLPRPWEPAAEDPHAGEAEAPEPEVPQPEKPQPEKPQPEKPQPEKPQPDAPKADESSPADPGVEKEVEAAVRRHYESIGRTDFERAYSYFGPSYRSMVDREGWIAGEGEQGIESSTVYSVGVGDLSGSEATAEVMVGFEDDRGSPRFEIVWNLVQHQGRWKLDEQTYWRKWVLVEGHGTRTGRREE